MVHDELRPAVEQVEQAGRSIRTFERVRLVHPYHRQPPAFGVDPIAGAGYLLFLRQQIQPGGKLFLVRYDFGQFCHLGLLKRGSCDPVAPNTNNSAEPESSSGLSCAGANQPVEQLLCSLRCGDGCRVDVESDRQPDVDVAVLLFGPAG